MKKATIYYAQIDNTWTKVGKLCYLEKLEHIGNVEWQEITPDKNNTWLTEGLENDFNNFISIGNKETKEDAKNSAIFINYSRGLESTRDNWIYNYNRKSLAENIDIFINTYNQEVYKWHNERKPEAIIDSFVLYDDKRIKWSSRLKECLIANYSVKFDPRKIRNSLYRPFSFQCLYFDEVLNHRRGQFPYIFPIPETEAENQVIFLPGMGNRKEFGCFSSQYIIALDFAFEKAQCFPFYTYNEDGTNRRENITDWALEQFRTHYRDLTIDLLQKSEEVKYNKRKLQLEQ